MTMLQTTDTNVVQSIRAFQPQALKNEAMKLAHHFLYADLGLARSRTQVFRMIARGFRLPLAKAKNHEHLHHCMTEVLRQSGPQKGFVVVLDHIPSALKFGAEARERLLDIFRDMADYWAKRRVPFRVFYTFAVAARQELEADISVPQADNHEAADAGLNKSRGRKPQMRMAKNLLFMRSVFDTHLFKQAA
jgi:hypothetical protein